MAHAEIPRHPQQLPGTFWGLTTFFNPAGYANKLQNYRIFRHASRLQGLKLLTVELVFGHDAPFCLREGADAEILIQLKASSVLWQKERLLNIGLRHLPENCDKVAWLDADILFRNDRWIEEASSLLESYKAVQPFSHIVRLRKGITTPDWKKRAGTGSQKDETVLCAKIRRRRWFNYENVGFCWCVRKDVIDRCGFYDLMIVGGADLAMFLAFYGGRDDQLDEASAGSRFHQYESYRAAVYAQVGGSVQCLEGPIAHLWHGQTRDRLYGLRHFYLAKYGFDPAADIRIGTGGCWEWSSDKPELHRYVESYFRIRNEEGGLFGNLSNLFPRYLTPLLVLEKIEWLVQAIVKKLLPGFFPALRRRYRSWKAGMKKPAGSPSK